MSSGTHAKGRAYARLVLLASLGAALLAVQVWRVAASEHLVPALSGAVQAPASRPKGDGRDGTASSHRPPQRAIGLGAYPHGLSSDPLDRLNAHRRVQAGGTPAGSIPDADAWIPTDPEDCAEALAEVAEARATLDGLWLNEALLPEDIEILAAVADSVESHAEALSLDCPTPGDLGAP